MSGKKRRNPLPLILIILLLPALGFTGWKAWSMIHQSNEEEDVFRNLSAMVAAEEQAAAANPEKELSAGNILSALLTQDDNFNEQAKQDIAIAQTSSEKKIVSNERPVTTETEKKTETGKSLAGTELTVTETDMDVLVASSNLDGSQNTNPIQPRETVAIPVHEIDDEMITETLEVDEQYLTDLAESASLSDAGDQLIFQTEMIPDEKAEPEREILPQYRKLHEINPDLFGWLRIEGTIIDYPVMYTPEDPEFYLRRGFYKDDAYSGTPFLEGHCDPEGNYYIIYAHHMKDEHMFHNLPDYEKEAYWREHQVIQLDTMYEEREYEVIAAFRSQLYETSVTGVFKYYEYTDLRDPEIFEEYMAGVRSLALYDTGLCAEYGDELLALSTCNYHTANGRFVVVAKRRVEEEGK